jgi:enoyl-CoA hydratase/carnithine racemase
MFCFCCPLYTVHQELNSIDLKLANALRTNISRWAENDFITCVFLKGSDGYFCGGADLDWLAQNQSRASELYGALGSLHKEVSAYPKALVSIINGDVNGSGMGLANTKFRIVKSTAKFSVPEASLGLVADGPVLKMLSKCDKQTKLPIASYLALSGQPIDADDMMRIGLATHQLGEENSIDALIYHLSNMSTTHKGTRFVEDTLTLYCDYDSTIDVDEVTKTIMVDSGVATEEAYRALEDQGWSKQLKKLMVECFECETVEETWNKLASHDSNEWAQNALSGLKSSPPLSLLATKRLIQESSKLSDFDAITLSQRVATRLATSPTFKGVIDRANSGESKETTLAELKAVSSDQVSELFEA